jgi:hypothetical protein
MLLHTSSPEIITFGENGTNSMRTDHVTGSSNLRYHYATGASYSVCIPMNMLEHITLAHALTLGTGWHPAGDMLGTCWVVAGDMLGSRWDLAGSCRVVAGELLVASWQGPISATTQQLPNNYPAVAQLGTSNLPEQLVAVGPGTTQVTQHRASNSPAYCQQVPNWDLPYQHASNVPASAQQATQ